MAETVENSLVKVPDDADKCDESPTKLHSVIDSQCNVKDNNTVALKDKLKIAHSNIDFLEKEHAKTLQGLYSEIERLQRMYTDLLFRCGVQGFSLPDNDFFDCDVITLEQKVNRLIKDNNELKKKLQEGNRALEGLDQKQKLEQWQHNQEISERDATILRLQKELEAKCCAVAELTAKLNRKKKSSFLHRFSFNSSDVSKLSFHPSIKNNISDHGSSRSLPHESDLSYSNYSSLSDKSASDDDISGKYSLTKQYSFSGSGLDYEEDESQKFKLPPIPGILPLPPKRQVIRHQIRLDKPISKIVSNTLAIDRVPSPELIVKRLTKI